MGNIDLPGPVALERHEVTALYTYLAASARQDTTQAARLACEILLTMFGDALVIDRTVGGLAFDVVASAVRTERARWEAVLELNGPALPARIVSLLQGRGLTAGQIWRALNHPGVMVRVAEVLDALGALERAGTIVGSGERLLGLEVWSLAGAMPVPNDDGSN
jgi:hypothetical protein